MKFKIVPFLVLVLFLSGCSTIKDMFDDDVTIVDGQLSDKAPVAVKLNSEDYMNLVRTLAAEDTNRAYYQMKTAMFQRAEPGDIVGLSAVEGLKNEKITTANDVDINKQNSFERMVSNILSGVGDIATKGVFGYVGGKAVENRDAQVVNQPAPLVLEQPEPIIVEQPVIQEPFIVEQPGEPIIIQ